MHERHDPVVPFSHGEALFAAAPGPKIHLWVDADGHADVMDVAPDASDGAVRELLGLAAAPSPVTSPARGGP
jgi:fermentation-respiration switch protein FrsA (DUF1100 family)